MDSLRNYINLFESMEKACEEEVEEGFVPFEKKKDSCEDGEDCEKEVTEDTLTEFDAAPMGGADMETGLEGTLDPRGLAKLLPEVDDINRFTSAVRKVQKGDIPSLSISENRQLAKAFISLLMDDSNTTMKVLQKLRMVHTKDEM